MSKKEDKDKDIRVVVGLDFGTTFSGFTYGHTSDKETQTNVQWPGKMGILKTNTVLQYDENLENVESWGFPALSKPPSRKSEKNERLNIVELFKLHLGNLPTKLREELLVDYKKAITDYLREIGNLIKETIDTRWSGIDFIKNVRFVLTVPAEYSEKEKAIIRECAHEAGFIDDKYSQNLQFTTEPEAAAIYCKRDLKEHDLNVNGTIFMIVDCGGGTVDLTTRKLLANGQLGEITERAGDYCGSTFIDKEFLKCLQRKLGASAASAMKLLREEHYGQLQYMVQHFCEYAKIPFTGDDPDFCYEMDLEEVCPVLKQYLSDEVKEGLEDDEWLIKFDFDEIKSMFDPVVERILRMIRAQLDNCREKCSIMFLVGGFSQSKYLQKRIRQEFQDRVDNISVPTNPIAAISRGAAIYGLGFNDNKKSGNSHSQIGSRVLKFTYGIEVLSPLRHGDPMDTDKVIPTILGPSTLGLSILRFHTIAKRGTVVKTDEELVVDGLGPCHPFQSSGEFEIYCTREYNAEFCDEPGMKLLGKIKIDWSNSLGELDRTCTFKLAFGKMEISATAVNDKNGQNYQAFFDIDTEN